jgi:hypothetical protein
MAGGAGDNEGGVTDGGVFKLEVFFVDTKRHLHHEPGDVLFRFFVAGIIRFMRQLVLGMAKCSVYAESIREFIHHDPVQFFGRYVAGQHFQIFIDARRARCYDGQ